MSIKRNILYLLKTIVNALILRPSYIFGIRGIVYTTAYLSYLFARFSVLIANKNKEINPNIYKNYKDIRNLKDLNNIINL